MTYTTAQPERTSRAATARPTVTLTGVQPTGDLHLGNYIGAIRPLADLAVDLSRDVYVFVADLHALNSRPDPAVLRERSRRLVAVLLACGLDRPNVHVYRQSRVPQVAGMAALLSNVAAKGLLNRAHAYKASVAANVAAGRDPDHGVNVGLYSYPLLMAADILALDADEVPVGADQAQHLEIAVDLAQQFSRSYRSAVLREPRALIAQPTATLPGLDGRKMSKSYGNAIPLMAEPDSMQADPADRHRLHATRAAEGSRHVHARRAAARVRRPGDGRRRRGALSHRRDRLRRGQGAARGRHPYARRADAQPLSATAHRPGRARRPACQGGAARLPARRPDARPDRGRHGPVAQQERSGLAGESDSLMAGGPGGSRGGRGDPP